jgi:hypothetical protein
LRQNETGEFSSAEMKSGTNTTQVGQLEINLEFIRLACPEIKGGCILSLGDLNIYDG